MAGVAGANIPVAQAYIADSTDAANRTRGMGLVGAAFGLGFIAGPAIGGGLSHFGYAVPGLFAAALSFVNAAAAYFYLPESLTPELRARAAEVTAVSPIARLKLATAFARLPAMTTLMAIYVLATFVFAVFTTVFPLLIEDRLGYGPRHAGYLMAYLGLLMAIIQGRLIGPMAHRYGERKLLVMGTVALVPAYALMPAAPALAPMAAVMVLVAFGSGINWPTLNSLASQYSPPDSQGGVLGVMQSLSALGRTAGAVWAGWVYGTWTPATPFALNSVLIALAAALAILFMIRAPAPPMARSEPAVGALV